MKSECGQIQTRLNAYLDKELDADNEIEIKAHTEFCSHCSARLASLKNSGRAFRGFSPAAASSDFNSNLKKKLDAPPRTMNLDFLTADTIWNPQFALLVFGLLFWISGYLPNPIVGSDFLLSAQNSHARELRSILDNMERM